MVVVAAFLSQRVFSTANQVGEEATLHQQIFSITSQREEEAVLLIEQNIAPARQVVVAVALLCKQDFSTARNMEEEAALRW